MFSIIKPRTLLVIPLFAISGCVQTVDSNVAQIPTAKAGAPSAPNNKKPIIVTSLLDVHSSKIVKEAKELVENQKFDQIEAKAAEYRHSQAMFVDGSWKLEYLYRGLVRLSNPDSNAEWEQRCKLIRNWVVSHPKSVTARVALARIYYKGASQARSGDVADKVSGAQWMTMKERLDEATKVLSGSTSMRNQCPGWYFVAQNVAFLLERPQAEYDAITDEAIRQFPHYYEFYFGKITYLMPRWFGNKGDWQKYATEVDRKSVV